MAMVARFNHVQPARPLHRGCMHLPSVPAMQAISTDRGPGLQSVGDMLIIPAIDLTGSGPPLPGGYGPGHG